MAFREDHYAVIVDVVLSKILSKVENLSDELERAYTLKRDDVAYLQDQLSTVQGALFAALERARPLPMLEYKVVVKTRNRKRKTA